MCKDDELGKVWENSKIKKLVENCEEQLPSQIKFQGYMAKLLRAKYRALIEEGFTEAQALELCKKLTMD